MARFLLGAVINNLKTHFASGIDMPTTIEYSQTAPHEVGISPNGMLSNVMKFRALVYGLASSITGNPPSLDLLNNIKNTEAYRLISAELAPVGVLLNNIEESIEDPNAMQKLAEEFQDLYIGPQALAVPLWESVYRDPEHLLFGKDTLHVRDFYADFGLVSVHKNNQPEDHIAVELEFMHRLAVNSSELLKDAEGSKYLESLIETQRAFLKEHLLQWAPQSFTLQLQHTKTDFYNATARLIIDFLPYDMDLLNEIAQGEIHD